MSSSIFINQRLFLQLNEPLEATQAYKPNDYVLLVVSVQPDRPETPEGEKFNELQTANLDSYKISKDIIKQYFSDFKNSSFNNIEKYTCGIKWQMENAMLYVRDKPNIPFAWNAAFQPTLSHNSELLTFSSAEEQAVLVNLYPLASQSFAGLITSLPWVIHLCNFKIYHLYPSLESVSVWLETFICPDP